MAVTKSKLKDAHVAFRAAPSPQTAAMYLSVLREAEEIGLVGDDEFHNGLGDIESYLWKGGSVVIEDHGAPVAPEAGS